MSARLRNLTVVFLLGALFAFGAPTAGAQQVIVEPEPTRDAGFSSSLEINSLGHPVVAYFDRAAGDLKVLVCGNVDCTAGNTVTAVDSEGEVGRYPSLALTADDRPIVVYQKWFPSELRMLQCGNPTCTAANQIDVIDTQFNAGESSALVIDSVGRPSVAYSTNALGVRLFACGDPSCASGNQTTMADTTYNTGSFVSMAFDALDRPVMAYWSKAEADLKVLACGDRNCIFGSRFSIPDTVGNTGQTTSIVLDSSGNPVIAYKTLDGLFGSDVNLLRCGDRACSSGNTIRRFPDLGRLYGNDALELDADGNPLVVFETDDNALALLRCDNHTCQGFPYDTVVLDNEGTRFGDAALELGADGRPVVSYLALVESEWKLRVLTCDYPRCGARVVALGLEQRVEIGSRVDGGLAIDFAYVVENLGTERLLDLRLADEFERGFGPGHIRSGPSVLDGACGAELLTGMSLAPREVCEVTVRVVVDPAIRGFRIGHYSTISALTAEGEAVSDLTPTTFFSVPFFVPPGDVNCDDSADIIDALRIAQYAAGVLAEVSSCVEPLPAEGPIGDVNDDQLVDIIDALVIAQCTAGVPNVFCPALD